MPKFILSYAYDVPYYRDFTVEADTAKEALEKAESLRAQGKLNGITGTSDGSVYDERVFLSEEKPVDEGCDDLPTIEQILGE